MSYEALPGYACSFLPSSHTGCWLQDAKVKRISDWLVKPQATSTKDLAAQVHLQHRAVVCVCVCTRVGH